MNTRALILERTAELLAQSPTGEVSTRAVCEAAGVTQPVLYRLFGDKDGLLAATSDRVWEEYLGMKRAARTSSDPVQDLRAGWDAHTAFALANPHAYRLLFGTRLSTRPEAAAAAMDLLLGVLERVARSGRLAMSPGEAAQVVMAANTGVALGLVQHPEIFGDPRTSDVVRDAAMRAILVDSDAPASPTAVAATTLRAGLWDGAPFTPAEAGLMDEWLGRIQDADRAPATH